MLLDRDFAGVEDLERIVVNPHVQSYVFKPGDALEAALAQHQSKAEVTLELVLGAKIGEVCNGANWQGNSGEPYCWLQTRRQPVKFGGMSGLILDLSEGDRIPVLIELMSPWNNQSLSVRAGDWRQELELDQNARGSFKVYQLLVPAQLFNPEQEFIFEPAKVLAPLTQGVGKDSRRLGVAIRSVDVG